MFHAALREPLIGNTNRETWSITDGWVNDALTLNPRKSEATPQTIETISVHSKRDIKLKSDDMKCP